MSAEAIRGHTIWTLAIVMPLSSALGDADYLRGPVPNGGRIFHASFDNGPKADAGAGCLGLACRTRRTFAPEDWEFTFCNGRVGKAIDTRDHPERALPKQDMVIPSGGEWANFKAQGHLCLRVGTISLWYQTNASGPALTITSQSNDNHIPPLIRLDGAGTRQSVHVGVMDRRYHDFEWTLPDAGRIDDQWYHLAFVWDEMQGIRIYRDGKIWLDEWGTSPYQTGYLSAGRLGLRGALFDEVRIFDIVLAESEIQALAAGETPTVHPSQHTSADRTRADHRLVHLGWANAPEDHFVTVGENSLIRRVPLDRVRAVRKQGWRGSDGREDSVWPLHYHCQEYPLSGGPLRLFLVAGERFNLLRVRGTIDEAAVRVSDEYIEPQDSRLLVDLPGKRFVANYPIDPPCAAPAVSVYPRQPSIHNSSKGRYYWSRRRELHDLALLDVRQKCQPKGEVVFQYELTPMSPDTVDGANRVRLIHWYRPEERRILMGAKQSGQSTSVAVPPLQYVHVMAPPQTTDRPLSAVRLQLQADGWKEDNTLNIRVHDPFNLWRALIDVDVRTQTRNRLDVTLEFPPTILPEGTELWVTIISRDGGTIRCGGGASQITAFGPDWETARKTYYATQHELLKQDFEILSEPHPWSYATKSNEHLRVALARYDAIARPMWDLYRRFPKDRWTIGYILWTQWKCRQLSVPLWESLPLNLPEDPEAPRWALLQKEISRLHFDFVDWWIDNRQAPNGAFGSGTGDDTDMLGDWPSLQLLSDRGGKIRRSQRLLTDLVWKHNMRDGLNVNFTDSLHAYEAGNNVQPYAFLMDYGNPVLFERLMATNRRYDGFLLTPARDGKREAAAGAFNFEKVTETGRIKQEHNLLILHAGLTTMWYNGHPALTRMMDEVYASDPVTGRNGASDLEFTLAMVKGDDRFLSQCKAPSAFPEWACIQDINETSEDGLRTLERRPMGPPASGRPQSRYLLWRYTRDKQHLVDGLEYLWKKLYYSIDLRTKTEQSGDRVHLLWNGSLAFLDYMYFGGNPGARNVETPMHHISYEGLSRDFAALVTKANSRSLSVVAYNFENKPQTGSLRVWRLQPGTYEIRMGIDENGDDRIDGKPEETFRQSLKRYERIALTLPSRRLYVIEAQLVESDPTPLYDRPDLAITHEDAERRGESLEVVVHNISVAASGPFTVEARDGAGRRLASRKCLGLEGVGDFKDKKETLKFSDMPREEDLVVMVEYPGREITSVNNLTRINASSDGATTAAD